MLPLCCLEILLFDNFSSVFIFGDSYYLFAEPCGLCFTIYNSNIIYKLLMNKPNKRYKMLTLGVAMWVVNLDLWYYFCYFSLNLKLFYSERLTGKRYGRKYNTLLKILKEAETKGKTHYIYELEYPIKMSVSPQFSIDA